MRLLNRDSVERDRRIEEAPASEMLGPIESEHLDEEFVVVHGEEEEEEKEDEDEEWEVSLKAGTGHRGPYCRQVARSSVHYCGRSEGA